MKNFKKIEEKYIDEIDSNVVIYEHLKTKARICTMKNDDDNKVFSIAFRTPPINSCGLTHILEHSVLCGSKNYPVKDPFVELLKGSLNTFLNAFTFADKTMYPIASKNLKDFRNLAHVYLDAVFYPRIYEHEEIFMQEGWHYHITDKNEPITYNGVVYNEMKGAFSDPCQILGREILHSLFPDTAYGFESGGDPKYIPDLSYDEFKDFHSKYYSPTNSYIFLYGDMNMEEELSWIEEEYLSKFDYVEFDTEIKDQKPFDKPVSYKIPYEIQGDLENKAYLAYNVALPSKPDYKLVLATHILLSSLFDVTGAPLNEALVNASIGADVSSSIDDEVKAPYISIVAEGANACDLDRFVSTIDNELKKILDNGLDKATILSIINHVEYEHREKMFSSRMPKGLAIQIDSMASWLYDDSEPCTKLESIKYYKELKEDLKTDYFENIIRNYILNNNHKSYVVLEPTADAEANDSKELADKLAKYKESLTEAELDELILKNKRLEEYQNSLDSKEAIDTLPKLALSDINPEPEEFNLEVIEGKYKTLFSEYHTNDILYLKYYFDISHLNYKDVMYASLFTDLFRDLNTNTYSYFELNQRIRNNLGSLNASLCPLETYSKEAKLYLTFSLGVLKENADIAYDLANIAIFENKFEKKRIKEKLAEFKASMVNALVGKGHQVALIRAFSFISEHNKNRDLASGVAYVDFINDLYDNFDERFDEIASNLSKVVKLISKSNMLVGITCDKQTARVGLNLADRFYQELPEAVSYEKNDFKPNPIKEAIKTSFNVNYVGLASLTNAPYHGSASVLYNTMSMDYLWDRVRVHGGAYGCMMMYSPTGNIGFTSYRDPNIDRTYGVYLDAPKWIEDINVSDEDLLKFKIGAIGNSQLVQHARDKGVTARTIYLAGNSHELRKKNRLAIINATNEDLRAFANTYKEALSNHSLCVLGNAKKIEESEIKFDSIRELK